MKNTEESIYGNLSKERKDLQAKVLLPEWYTTAGWQMFKQKYLFGTDQAVKGQFERIAKTAAKHLKGTKYEQEAEDKFFNLLWNGWLSPSTPILANMGTDRGLPVSCSGGYVHDSIDGFYSTLHETVLLTKHGFGTSGYFGDIRPRGSSISVGGKASGIMPVYKQYILAMQDVSQGSSRRGAFAAYLPIEHGDFDELADFVLNSPDDANVGWNITDNFIAKLEKGDPEAIRRFQKAMKLKMVTGRGYFCFIDKINRKRPQAYANNNLYVKASNLCNEIALFSDENHTFTCVLSSMNVSKYDEWKDTDAIFWATLFLDCVCSEFIEKAKNIKGLEKAVRFTEKGRALGLGQCGFHTLLQKKMLTFSGFETHMLSQEIAGRIWEEANKASKELALIFGEPEWCKGTGKRNSHLIAIAPTKSTALLIGGISEGINPDPAMTYNQLTAAGEVLRINPVLLQLMKDKGCYSEKNIQKIIAANGSVQGTEIDFLTDEEKEVFKTAFEINQKDILRLASSRARFIDQWQSLNLFFAADEDPVWIAEVHKQAFLDENILGLYYVYTQSGVKGSKGDCEACM